MLELDLSGTTNPSIKNLIQGIIGIVEIIFPNRIKSCYLIGSHVDGTAVSNSDLDIIFVFENKISQEEKDAIWELSDNASLLAPVFLDIEGIGEDQLDEKGTQIKLASCLLCGDDIRDNIQLPSMHDYLREWMYGHPIHFMMRVARKAERLYFPLDFPDVTKPFFGYENNSIETKSDTKLLVAIVSQIAAALVIYKANIYIPKKSSVLELYRKHVNDEWTELVEQVFSFCRTKWEYQLPVRQKDHELLKKICRRTLEFENHYLSIYRSFLIAETASSSSLDQNKAIQQAGKIIFRDK